MASDSRIIAHLPRCGGRPPHHVNGVAYQEGSEPPYQVPNYRPLKNPDAPVAILMDKGTGSSAESLVIAFAGRPNVRRFGEETANFSTVDNPVRLADGAVIYMTVGWNADRHGRKYEGAIEPDERVAGSDEEILNAARNWLGHHAGRSG